MRKLKWQTVFQFVIVALGIIIGVYFSMKSNKMHAKIHEGLKLHTSINHGYIDISNDSIIPKLEKIEVIKDAMSGWNLHIYTKNFQFTPANVSSKHLPGEGHAHLIINGDKVARIYSDWFHIPELKYEINELEVTLNANSHAIMSINEKPISIKLEEKLLLVE